MEHYGFRIMSADIVKARRQMFAGCGMEVYETVGAVWVCLEYEWKE